MTDRCIAVVGPLADGRPLRFYRVADAGHFFRDLFAGEAEDARAKFLQPLAELPGSVYSGYTPPKVRSLSDPPTRSKTS